jgi:RNA polymerase sigma factor for flagellar operon FliA
VKLTKKKLAVRNELVEAHLYLVRPIAQMVMQSLPVSFDLDDLIQAGTLGLIDAAARYDPANFGDTPFTAWARCKIRGAVLSSIRRRHYTENTRLSIDDIGANCGNFSYLDAGAGSGSTTNSVANLGDRATLINEPAVEPALVESIDRGRKLKAVQEAVEALPKRKRKVIEMHYKGEMKLAKVGKRLKVCPSRASQIHMETIGDLRN